MNIVSIVSVCIAAVALIFTIVKFGGEQNKAKESDRENFLKVNLKLDQICTQLTEMRVEQKTLDNRMVEMDKRLSILDEQMKVANHRIDDLERSKA